MSDVGWYFLGALTLGTPMGLLFGYVGGRVHGTKKELGRIQRLLRRTEAR